jgi:predicted nucleic acid-binding protein
MKLFMDNLLLDSDFLYGLFVENDPHNQNCQNLLPKISDYRLIISNLVIYEFITLISRRVGQKEALSILSQIENLDILKIVVDEEVHKEILAQFKTHTKKNISAVDCSNLALAQKYKAKIASFDQFYPPEMLIS